MQQTKLWMLAAILTLCGTMSVFAQNQKPSNLKGQPGTWVFMAKLSNPDDTILIVPTDDMKSLNTVVRDQNGAFLFSTPLTETKTYFILTPSTLRHQGGFSMLFDAVPGEVLAVQGLSQDDKPANGLTYDGTKFYQHYAEALIAQKKVKDDKSAQPAIDFIKTYPNDEIAAVLVENVGIYDPDRLEDMLATLSPTIRNGRLKGFIDKQIVDSKEYLKQREMEGKTLKPSSTAPDFTLNDINGQPLTLSKMGNEKIIVLDFWGSWCTWCIKGFPDMKKYYEKYKNKLEIIGMDCSDTEAKWKKAVADNELPWKHVFVPKGSTVLTDYLISAFPTKVIIGNGKVLSTVIGEDPKFYELLDTLFAE